MVVAHLQVSRFGGWSSAGHILGARQVGPLGTAHPGLYIWELLNRLGILNVLGFICSGFAGYQEFRKVQDENFLCREMSLEAVCELTHSFSREQQPVTTDEQLPTGLLDPAVPFVPI